MLFVFLVLQPTILITLEEFSVKPWFGVCTKYLLRPDSLHVASRSELPQFLPPGGWWSLSAGPSLYLGTGPAPGMARGHSRCPTGCDRHLAVTDSFTN